MDDPIFKTKYHKYKTKVKIWEKSFREKNGRVPSKVCAIKACFDSKQFAPHVNVCSPLNFSMTFERHPQPFAIHTKCITN